MNRPRFPVILSIKRKNACFTAFFLRNIWNEAKNFIPLHPLLRTNAVTKQLLSRKEQRKKEFFEKITINREVVVQEADFTSYLINIRRMRNEVWVKRNLSIQKVTPIN